MVVKIGEYLAKGSAPQGLRGHRVEACLQGVRPWQAFVLSPPVAFFGPLGADALRDAVQCFDEAQRLEARRFSGGAWDCARDCSAHRQSVGWDAPSTTDERALARGPPGRILGTAMFKAP